MSSVEGAVPAAGPPLKTSREDDPRVLEEAATEDYSLHVVPHSWRMDKGKLTMAWYAVMTAFFYMYFAAFIALAYGIWNVWNAVIGLVLTVIGYTLVNTVILKAASESGLTVALFSRSMYGFVGASLATLIFAATCIYYLVFEGSVVSVALEAWVGGPLKMWYAIVIVATAPLVWKGVRVWLDRLNAGLLPFYFIALVVVIIWALSSEGYHGFLPGTKAAPGTHLPWLQAFTAYMGVWILMMFTMDFARLARPKDHRYHTAVTFGWLYFTLTFFVNGLIGILLVSTFKIDFAQLAGQESALPVKIVGLTGIVGVLLIVITQMRINTVNLYLASSNLQSFFSRVFSLTLPRTVWVVVACAIGYLLMLTNVFSYVNDALAYQGIFIVAWVGTALAHVAFLTRSKRKFNQIEFRPGRVPAFNPGGLAAVLIATAVGLVLKLTDSDTSQFNEMFGLIITFVIAFFGYMLAVSVAKPAWFEMKRGFDPRQEVEDPWEDRVECYHCKKGYLAQEMDRDPSHGHEAICAACATTPGFYSAARQEAVALALGEKQPE